MERKEREEGKKKEPSPYLSKLSWNGLSKYTTETQWKNDTTLVLSGTVVLARTHSKLESIFPSLDVLDGEGGWQRPGAGQEMAKQESNG